MRGAPARALAALVFFVAFAGAALAATLPALTGRVVDDAHILKPATVAALTDKLKALEDKSGIQFVVATTPSLGGQDIAPFANDLFRGWKLGQAKKDDGLLLLVAPNERRVRFEVGYGLEGTMTDAVSFFIVSNAIGPRFKAGDYDGGVTKGVDDAIAALTTDAGAWKPKGAVRQLDPQGTIDRIVPFLVFFFILFVMWNVLRSGAGARVTRGGGMFIPMGGGGFGGGFSGGGGFGGGFSGGGGSSGGGGASGSW